MGVLNTVTEVQLQLRGRQSMVLSKCRQIIVSSEFSLYSLRLPYWGTKPASLSPGLCDHRTTEVWSRNASSETIRLRFIFLHSRIEKSREKWENWWLASVSINRLEIFRFAVRVYENLASSLKKYVVFITFKERRQKIAFGWARTRLTSILRWSQTSATISFR